MKTALLLLFAAPVLAQNGLTATQLSGNQIQLNWQVSTTQWATPQYLIESCAGKNCTNFAQIASSTALTYTDSNLLHYTFYMYRVRATDGFSFSPYGRVAGVSTVDLVLQSSTGDRCTAVASMTSTPLVTFTCNQNNLDGPPGLRLTSTVNNVNNVTNGVGYAALGLSSTIFCLVAVNEDPVNTAPATLDSATVLTLAPSSIAYSCSIDCTPPLISGVWTLTGTPQIKKLGLLQRIWNRLTGRP